MKSKEKLKPPYEFIIVGWVLVGIGFGVVFGIFGGYLAGGTALMLSFGFAISIFGPIINCFVLKIQSTGGALNTLISLAITALLLSILFFLFAISGIFNFT